jgi:hypothetical protein
MTINSVKNNVKTSMRSTSMHRKIFVGLKSINKVAILEWWSILKEKNKMVFKFSITIMKLYFLVFIELSRWEYLWRAHGPKIIYFLAPRKISNRYITRPYWFWAPNSVFGLIFAFLTPKTIFFLASCKTADQWI